MLPASLTFALPSTPRSVALGVLAGFGYLAVQVATAVVVHDEFPVDISSSFTGAVGIVAYVFGGLWLVGAVPATLFVAFGTVLPLGLLALDYLLFVADPTVGDLKGPPPAVFWPAYLLAFGVLAVAEYGSLVLLADAPPVVLTLRTAVVVLAFAALVGVGSNAVLPLWRVVPQSVSLPVSVENDDDVARRVDVTVVDEATGERVFSETVTVDAGETVTFEDAVTHLRRYRVVGTLPDGTTDRYVFEPRRRASVVGVVVWVEGELGPLAVLGRGSGP
ncbi:hypothetical protein [Halomarina oriensis]|uniref:Uncharacterized protein n=1 Tax=Halomarina oriensis TaxID=671145 RepID=A0A6B0GJ82_9EURY|nr:hypothetical protein [Halomarina oriensis]MWG34892.1 hypothetical protein [Halomarina oriensis]